MPWKKVVEKPRDDVYFLKDQDPPAHNFQDALDVLRAYAFTDEAVVVHLTLNVLKEKKVSTTGVTLDLRFHSMQLFPIHFLTTNSPQHDPDCSLCRNSRKDNSIIV